MSDDNDGPEGLSPDLKVPGSDRDRRSGGCAVETRSTRRRRPQIGVVLLIIVSYLPLLLTKPGKVGADTKTYLYLNPGRLLSRAPYMWDPNIGLGTVTHQNIGYLWPMGPYYFLMDAIGLPDWVAQRLWLGSIILAAGIGVRFMLRELRWQSAGLTVASFAYALSPYLVDYGARISVILLPFAGLPWLIGLSARALRRNDWQTPAIFALVTLTVGGVNATSLLLVMVGPLLWFIHATFVEKEINFRRALIVGLRITALTLITSLWWMAGLLLQGSHGIPILRYTETYETVANAALSTELLRGLGYWFFYGTDGLGPWTKASQGYIESPVLITISFLIPGLAFAAALLTRFRHRIFFAGIVLIGLVIGVGSHPWDSPSPYGSLFKAFSKSDMGLSFRSTPRAVPLIALGLAVFLGAGTAALARWRPGWHRPVAAVLLVLICINQLPLFQGLMVDRNLMRNEQLPTYWTEAARALDAGDRDTRVYAMPGIDFASYRWGNTVDPVMPGLTDREFVARELIPYGSPPSANLLNDIDAPFQAGRVEPRAIAPIARLMGVGDILLRSDLQYERYRTPRPRTTYEQLMNAAGLAEPISFGEPEPNVPVPELRLDDEMYFGTPRSYVDPPPLSVFPVEDPRPMLRTVGGSSPVVMAGDGAGVVALASIGALDVDRPLFYSASFAKEPKRLNSLTSEPGSGLVVTDTNRRQARRWGSVRDNDGLTERAGQVPLAEDRTDNRLLTFPDETDGDRTVAVPVGGASVSASAYGNGVTYTAGDRAVKAFDGDPSTAWAVAAFDDPLGEFIEVNSDQPLTTDHVTLLQSQSPANRHITAVDLSFDGGQRRQFQLDDSSRTSPGQTLTFPEHRFSKVRITITSTDPGEIASYKGKSGVGFAEISVPGVGPLSEVARPPTSLLKAVGRQSIGRPLSYVFTRRASNPGDTAVADEEPVMSRYVIGPVSRTFQPYGLARLSAKLTDETIDRIIGLPDAAAGGVTATSSRRLPGDPKSRASTAVDGDPSTAYQSPINDPLQSLEFVYPQPVSVDDLNLSLIADGKHSVPTALSITIDDGPPIPVDVPRGPLGDGSKRGTVRSVELSTGPLSGTKFVVKVDAVDEAKSTDWFSGNPTVLPVGIAEMGLPVVQAPSDEAPLSSSCRSDLLTIAGAGVPVSLSGTIGDALASRSLHMKYCGGDNGVAIDKGTTLLESSPGLVTGFDVDMVALASTVGGAAGADTLTLPARTATVKPDTDTKRTGRNSYEVHTKNAARPYWVVLGQSYEPGWTATTSDGKDLGKPVLVNGYANGWRIDPAKLGSEVTVELAWAPQRAVWFGLGLSALGVLLCIALSAWPNRSRRKHVDSGVSSGLMAPDFENPTTANGAPLGYLSRASVSIGFGLIGLVVAGPVVAVAALILTALAAETRFGQILIRGVCLGLLAAAFAYVIAKQVRNGYRIDFEWVKFFEITNDWSVLATILLVSTIVVERLRDRSATRLLRDSEENES